VKRIYFEPAGRLVLFDKGLILYPPEGYEFTTEPTAWDKVTKGIINNDFLFFTLQKNILQKLFPPNLLKSYLEGFLKKAPTKVDLTFARNHLVFRKEPWVVHVEWLTALTGFRLKHLERFKPLVIRCLASNYCKRILTWSEVSKKSILHNLPQTLEPKVEMIPLAVQGKKFVKNYSSNGKVKLLFIGSANIPGEFELKGGKEVLEAFALLSQKYSNLELVIRSDVPSHIRGKCLAHPNIKLVEGVIPWEELEQEFKSADIFLFPGHHTPFNTILDAMSYELPMIITDVFANSELVEDGKTGFVIQPSQNIPHLSEDYIPIEHTSLRSQLKKTMGTVDTKVVQGLVEKTSILIEHSELRRNMGKAGRQKVEQGKFSIKKRNEKLKKIFDEATASSKP